MHGYDHPWAGGAGKNLLPMTVSGIKALNTSGVWNGNVYTINNTTIEILSDGTNVNVHGFKVNTLSGGASANVDFMIYADLRDSVLSGTRVTLNGCPYGGGASSYRLYVWNVGFDNGGSITNNVPDSTCQCGINIASGYAIASEGLLFYPMVRLATVTDATYAPYSNICPISGRTETSVVTRNEDNTDSHTATISFGQTVYGGQVDFNEGTVEVTDGYIASYDSETLPSTWISDRDVYAEGTTPTTGAEVCYELATSTTLTLTPDELTMLKGYNSVTGDGVITITAYTGSSYPVEITRKRKTKKKGGK